MITMYVMLKRRSDLTREQFRQHYETVHVALGKKYAGHLFHDYHRDYVYAATHVTAESYGGAGGHTAPQNGFDVITSIVFKDQADCDEFFRIMGNPAVGDVFRNDENNFIDRSQMYIYFTQEVKTWVAADVKR